MKFSTMTIAATEAEAIAVLETIKDRYGVTGKYGPSVWYDLSDDDVPRIIWEGAPESWDIEVSLNMLDRYPEGIWLEPINCYSIRVFKEVPAK